MTPYKKKNLVSGSYSGYIADGGAAGERTMDSGGTYTLTTYGGVVLIVLQSASIESKVVSASSVNYLSAIVRVYRNGTFIGVFSQFHASTSTFLGVNVTFSNRGNPTFIDDSAPAGVNVYTLKFEKLFGGSDADTNGIFKAIELPII